jgi:hypothetical protein
MLLQVFNHVVNPVLYHVVSCLQSRHVLNFTTLTSCYFQFSIMLLILFSIMLCHVYNHAMFSVTSYCQSCHFSHIYHVYNHVVACCRMFSSCCVIVLTESKMIMMQVLFLSTTPYPQMSSQSVQGDHADQMLRTNINKLNLNFELQTLKCKQKSKFQLKLDFNDQNEVFFFFFCWTLVSVGWQAYNSFNTM